MGRLFAGLVCGLKAFARMKPKRTLAEVEADHKSKGLMREANRTALLGLLGLTTFAQTHF